MLMNDPIFLQDLADYMLKVAKDNQLFASYLWWRQFYKVKLNNFLLNEVEEADPAENNFKQV